MSYKVGQILYIVPSRQTSVYPMQVSEEITRKTLNGTETEYVLVAGGTDQKFISHKDIQGEIFETAEQACTILTERATRSIAKLIESAQKKAKEWYPSLNRELSDFTLKDKYDLEKNKKSSQETTITLEDGTVARLKLPDILKE